MFDNNILINFIGKIKSTILLIMFNGVIIEEKEKKNSYFGDYRL